MVNRTAIVVSQSRSTNPAHRALEDAIVDGILKQQGLDITIVRNLCDLKPDGPSLAALRGIQGDMIVLSWLFPRATHWVLDRNGISGRVGQTALVDESRDEVYVEPAEGESKRRVIENRTLPDRTIYCLDLRVHGDAQPYVDEIVRIVEGERVHDLAPPGGTPERGTDANEPKRIDEAVSRRWYPVIDYSRCTNCMECIDFCLFGVYGLDRSDAILVEQPDNCRKGCPACSRVCPESAIIFPQHKTPAIAGDLGDTSGAKIDLSALFGAPDDSADPVDLASRERDEQRRLSDDEGHGHPSADRRGQKHESRDELDDLVDQLDDLDL